MAGRETPRQRMIGIMYLVLTALLALNVSKDVINAFVVVNESVVESNYNLSHKLDDIYSNFEKNYLFNQAKVKPFWDKAIIAKELSDEMVDYVLNVRYEVISKTEGIPIDSAKNISVTNINKKDNYDIPTNYFIGSPYEKEGGAAKALKNKIDTYKAEMLKLVDLKNIDNINLGLNTKGPYFNAEGVEEKWETHFFYNTILAADIAILNKIISDIYNAEFDVVNLLHKSIGQGDFKFDKIEAKILPESKYVFSGDDYKAEIIVAAYDTSQSPEVYYKEGISFLPDSQINEAKILKSQSGKIFINLPARNIGNNKYAGVVKAKTGLGLVNSFHFSGEYYVTKPSYSISAKKMNVFYIGVDNPVSIDISGIPRENISPAISVGTIKPDPSSNDWIVTVPNGTVETIINVRANISDEVKNMGAKRFRVKNLPDPIATIANKSSGIINREIMIAAGAILPKMPADFEFDHSFVISSFTMTIQRGFKVYNLESKNTYLTSEMVEQIKKTNRGQSVVFENIIARDPEGIDREISSIVLTIN